MWHPVGRRGTVFGLSEKKLGGEGIYTRLPMKLPTHVIYCICFLSVMCRLGWHRIKWDERIGAMTQKMGNYDNSENLFKILLMDSAWRKSDLKKLTTTHMSRFFVQIILALRPLIEILKRL